MEVKSVYKGIKRVDFLDNLFRAIARRSDELLLTEFHYDLLRVEIKAAIDDYYETAPDIEKYSTSISIQEAANRVLKYHEYRKIKSMKLIDYATDKGLSIDDTLIRAEEFMNEVYKIEIKKKPKAFRSIALVNFVKDDAFISKFEEYVSKDVVEEDIKEAIIEDILEEEVIND